MGLAASQARLLTITSRISSNELKQQRIAMDKMRLAADTDKVAQEYSTALNNQTLTLDDAQATYSAIISAGYGIQRVNDSQRTSLPESTIEWVKSAQYKAFKNEYGSRPEKLDHVLEADEEVPTNEKGKTYDEWAFAQDDAYRSAGFFGNCPTITNDVDDACVQLSEQLIASPEFLIQGLLNGYFMLVGSDGKTKSLTTEKHFETVYDKSDDAIAEAKYNKEMSKINRKEKLLDQQAKQLDTEYSTLTTELESVKSIISSHTSNDFNMFS